MEAAQETNALFAQRDEVLQLIAEKQGKAKEAATLTNELEKIKRRKQEMAAKADWPVEGLGFGPKGVVIRGVDLAECSAAQRRKIGVAIAMRKNPQFPFAFVREASLLDHNSMAELVRDVAAHGGQCFAERVGKEACHIVFEDGIGTEVND
jgi:hypothetical protein